MFKKCWSEKTQFRPNGIVSSTCYKSSPETELVLGQILTLMNTDQNKNSLSYSFHTKDT